MTGENGLQKIAIHAIVIDDQNLDHAAVLNDNVL